MMINIIDIIDVIDVIDIIDIIDALLLQGDKVNHNFSVPTCTRPSQKSTMQNSKKSAPTWFRCCLKSWSSQKSRNTKKRAQQDNTKKNSRPKQADLSTSLVTWLKSLVTWLKSLATWLKSLVTRVKSKHF